MQVAMGGGNATDKRQNYSLNLSNQQQAQLKQTLQKQGAKVDLLMNSAYSLKTTNRKQ